MTLGQPNLLHQCPGKPLKVYKQPIYLFIYLFIYYAFAVQKKKIEGKKEDKLQENKRKK